MLKLEEKKRDTNTLMKKFKTKTLYKGQVALNSNLVEELVSNNEDIWIYYKDQIMVLPPEELKKGKIIDPIRYKDRYKPFTTYQLLYYDWKPNRDQEHQVEAFSDKEFG